MQRKHPWADKDCSRAGGCEVSKDAFNSVGLTSRLIEAGGGFKSIEVIVGRQPVPLDKLGAAISDFDSPICGDREAGRFDRREWA